MRPSTKSLVLLLVAAVAAAAVAAAASAGRNAVSDGGILDHIKKAGVMKVGIAVDPPLTFRGTHGDWQSMVPTLDRKLAQSLGVKIEFVPTTFTTIVAGQLANKYDFIGASLNATPDRKKVLDFSVPFSYAGTSYLVPKDSKLHTMKDLENATIAFVTGSSDDEATRRALPHAHDRAIPNATVIDLVAEVLSKRSDALATANLLAPALMKKYGWRAIPADTTKGIYPVGISWAVPKGNADLVKVLDAFLKKEWANGDIKRLQDQYFTPANTLKG